MDDNGQSHREEERIPRSPDPSAKTRTRRFTPNVKAGLELPGHLKLIRPLGRGAMGVVWLAEVTNLRFRRALKFVPPELSHDIRAHKRIKEEALRVVRLNHNNIVRVHCLEEDEQHIFFVMDYAEGWQSDGRTIHDLSELIAYRKTMSEQEVRGFLPPLLNALQYVHTFRDDVVLHGIIHRDIKPNNILLANDGAPLLADFGISHSVSSSASSVSGVMPSSGTLAYMPPEAIRGRKTDRTWDIYSLGMMIYEMLTGNPPFWQGDVTYQHINEQVPIVKGVSEEINAIIQKAVAKVPEERWQSCTEMLKSLRGATLPDPERPNTSVSALSELDHFLSEEEEREEHLSRAKEYFDKLNAGETTEGIPKNDVRRRQKAWEAYLLEFEDTGYEVGRAKERLAFYGNTAPKAQSDKNFKEDLGNGVALEMVWVEGGTFEMGSNDGDSFGRPAHTVDLDGFWMGKYPVTQKQYECITGDNPAYFKRKKGGFLRCSRTSEMQPSHPVEQISWTDATGFCSKLSQRTDKTFGLPTEAQWEYACRAGSSNVFCFGDSESGLDMHAWHFPNSERETHAVGQKRANTWGLHDMHGNVWEWILDWYDSNYYAQSPPRDPTGPSLGSLRLFRGGSWRSEPEACSSAYRRIDKPGRKYINLGFRVACVPRTLPHQD